jgi:thioredoxin reductase (NADPH)
MSRGPRLTLYSRAYCHLCHDMQAEVEGLRSEFDFELSILDVDSDASLEERYGEVVPVLAHGDVELARTRLDCPALRAYLKRLG